MGRPRRYPDHPLWVEIDKLKAEGKPVPSSMMNKVQQDPNKPAQSRRQRFPSGKPKTRRRPLKRAGKAKEIHEEKQKRKQIVRDPRNFKPVKKVPKKCEHPVNRLSLVSYRGSASTGDFTGYYRCDACKEMIRVDRKVNVSA